MTGGALCFTVCSKQYDTVNTKQLVDKKGKIERRSNTEYCKRILYFLYITTHYIVTHYSTTSFSRGELRESDTLNILFLLFSF